MIKFTVVFFTSYCALLFTGLPVFISRYNKTGIFITIDDLYNFLLGAILPTLLVFLYNKLTDPKNLKK